MADIVPKVTTSVPSAVTWTNEEKALMKRTVANGLSDTEFALFLYSANHLNLDPLAKQIYAVKYGGKMTLQTSIDGYRLVAHRSGNYAGSDNARLRVKTKSGESITVPHEEFDPDEHKIISASIDVRFKKKDMLPQSGTALFSRYAKVYNGKLAENWEKMPDVMLLKCAEAQALRKAFPNDIHSLYIPEEMEQAKKNAVDVEFHEVSSLNLSDLKPGDVSTHTEPDRAPAKAEPEPPIPEDEVPEYRSTTSSAEADFHAAVLKILPKCNEDQYNYLVDAAFTDCEISAWEECELNPKYRARLKDWCGQHLANYIAQMKKGKK